MKFDQKLQIFVDQSSTPTTSHPPMPSYEASGRNITKLPRPPHCNTMFDVLVLGYGLILPGDGAAALFYGVHILGEIWTVGGLDTLAEL